MHCCLALHTGVRLKNFSNSAISVARNNRLFTFNNQFVINLFFLDVHGRPWTCSSLVFDSHDSLFQRHLAESRGYLFYLLSILIVQLLCLLTLPIQVSCNISSIWIFSEVFYRRFPVATEKIHEHFVVWFVVFVIFRALSTVVVQDVWVAAWSITLIEKGRCVLAKWRTFPKLCYAVISSEMDSRVAKACFIYMR